MSASSSATRQNSGPDERRSLSSRTPTARNIYRIKTCRDFAATCQLRVDRRGKSIHIFADNRELATISLKKNVPARTGLHSDGAADLRAANVLYYVVSETR